MTREQPGPPRSFTIPSAASQGDYQRGRNGSHFSTQEQMFERGLRDPHSMSSVPQSGAPSRRSTADPLSHPQAQHHALQYRPRHTESGDLMRREPDEAPSIIPGGSARRYLHGPPPSPPPSETSWQQFTPPSSVSPPRYDDRGRRSPSVESRVSEYARSPSPDYDRRRDYRQMSPSPIRRGRSYSPEASRNDRDRSWSRDSRDSAWSGGYRERRRSRSNDRFALTRERRYDSPMSESGRSYESEEGDQRGHHFERRYYSRSPEPDPSRNASPDRAYTGQRIGYDPWRARSVSSLGSRDDGQRGRRMGRPNERGSLDSDSEQGQSDTEESRDLRRLGPRVSKSRGWDQADELDFIVPRRSSIRSTSPQPSSKVAVILLSNVPKKSLRALGTWVDNVIDA